MDVLQERVSHRAPDPVKDRAKCGSGFKQTHFLEYE